MKPCPDCGSEAEIVHRRSGFFLVKCKRCPTSTLCHSTIEEAVETWDKSTSWPETKKALLEMLDRAASLGGSVTYDT